MSSSLKLNVEAIWPTQSLGGSRCCILTPKKKIQIQIQMFKDFELHQPQVSWHEPAILSILIFCFLFRAHSIEPGANNCPMIWVGPLLASITMMGKTYK